MGSSTESGRLIERTCRARLGDPIEGIDAVRSPSASLVSIIVRIDLAKCRSTTTRSATGTENSTRAVVLQFQSMDKEDQNNDCSEASAEAVKPRQKTSLQTGRAGLASS